MKTRLTPILAAVLSLLFVRVMWAQDLGPQIKKLKDGIYVYVGKEFNSNRRDCPDPRWCRADR